MLFHFSFFFLDVEVTDAWDRLFCHCLVAAVTGFANLLMLAARGKLNHANEFIKDSSVASQQWLDIIAAKGVLVCFRTAFLPTVVSFYLSLLFVWYPSQTMVV